MSCDLMGHEGEDEPAIACEACVDRLRAERDEARALVREYWKRLKGHPTMLTYEFHLNKYPWLKE